MLQSSHSFFSNVVTFCRFFQSITFFHYQTAVNLASLIFRRRPTVFHSSSSCESHSKSSLLGTPCITENIKTTQQNIKMRGQRVVRTASIHTIFLDPRIFILKSREKEDGVGGVGVNRHAHRHVLILPAKRVFFSSELRRHSGTTLHYRVPP